MRAATAILSSSATALLFCGTPTIGAPTGSKFKAAYARKVMRDFARCTVKREPVLARRYVLLNIPDLNDAEFQRVFSWTCLARGQLKMRQWQYRGALAEELIRTDLAGRTATDFSGASALNWSVPPKTYSTIKDADLRKKQQDIDLAESYVGQLGECVVRVTPVGSLAVLQTPNDSPAEIAALKRIAPRIAGCVSAGNTLKFNRTNLRNAMAISYYRLAAGGAAYAQAGAVK